MPTPSGKLRLRAASVRSGGYLSEGAGDVSMEPSPPTPMRKRPRDQKPLPEVGENNLDGPEARARPEVTTPLMRPVATSTEKLEDDLLEDVNPGDVTLPMSEASTTMPSLLSPAASPISPRQHREEEQQGGAIFRREGVRDEGDGMFFPEEVMEGVAGRREVVRRQPTGLYIIEFISELKLRGHFEGEIRDEHMLEVMARLQREWGNIANNNVDLSVDGIRDNIIRHGREMVDDGWLRSPVTGEWHLIPEEELEQMRVRQRRLEELRRRRQREERREPRDPRLARVRENHNAVPPPEELLGGNREGEAGRQNLGDLGNLGNCGNPDYNQDIGRGRGRNRADRGGRGTWGRGRARAGRMGRFGDRAEQRGANNIIGIQNELREDLDNIRRQQQHLEQGIRRMNLGERERRRERRGNAERRREGRREGKRFDPWVSLVRVKMDNPAVTAWRHRMRVQEELVKMTHPQREHIERVLESEERRVRDDARAILRFRHIAGMSTQLDIEWPPRDEVTVRMEDGGR